ncbi:hypothetical protein [Rhodopirellula europaea]|jgi:hypothetical protein|uniref:Secreted protein n=1 Tax=Rhodopirellula europaea SH398 TaxID=1263868 RepID=M5RXV8_9BACT|nr:hypothetical protein [Rhodopirellula europaea]EMI24193.1 secreted protein [Rhodopirellula europaea SH398]
MIRSAILLPLLILTCIGCSGEDPKDKVGLVLEVCAFTADFAKTDIARVDPNTTVGEALSKGTLADNLLAGTLYTQSLESKFGAQQLTNAVLSEAAARERAGEKIGGVPLMSFTMKEVAELIEQQRQGKPE